VGHDGTNRVDVAKGNRKSSNWRPNCSSTPRKMRSSNISNEALPDGDPPGGKRPCAWR
jgi:hypothetical protein